MKWTLIFLAGIISSPLFADVTVQPIFGDNMVLQRNSSVKLWGTAKPGERVSISTSWKKFKKFNTPKDGKWQVELKTPTAGGPYTLTIRGKNTIKFKNIMIGEVWLCTGQSNMDCDMGFFKDTKEAIAQANYPNIRFFVVNKKVANEPLAELGGKWTLCTPETTAKFSATGYFFGLKLYKDLNIPIGLIECAWGGTRVEAWTPWEKQKGNLRLVKERKDAAKRAESYDEAKEKQKHEAAVAKFKTDTKTWEAGGKKGKKPHWPHFKEHPLKTSNYSSNLYNGMINPLAPYTVKGAIWYQGESNAWMAKEYADQLALMISSWRERWRQGNFPFYFVQLPGFQPAWKDPVEERSSWALMREAFAEVAEKVPNTGMAVTIDIGETYDIHPQQKSKVGERLARLALKKDYGKDIPWSGPIMKSCEFKDGKAIVKFDTGGSPLTAKDSKVVKGFAFCDKNGVFIRAKAQVIGDDTVEVFSENVKNPTIVYYAWAQNPEGVNLINKAGLPASPFRFGKKPEVNLTRQVIPEKIIKQYELVYEINPKSAVCQNGTKFEYVKDNSDKITGPFKKIAYCLTLQNKKGEIKYVLVEMDPFTNDIKKIGVPDKASGARFQQDLKNVRVKSNVEGVKNGMFPDGCNIEFWDCNYAGGNQKHIAGASDKFDFGDAMNTGASPGYGSMQIHNNQQKQTIFSFNNFRAGSNADLGIGNAKGGNPDWTFSASANRHHAAELKVFIKR